MPGLFEVGLPGCGLLPPTHPTTPRPMGPEHKLWEKWEELGLFGPLCIFYLWESPCLTLVFQLLSDLCLHYLLQKGHWSVLIASGTSSSFWHEGYGTATAGSVQKPSAPCGILRAWCSLSCLPPDGAGFQMKVVSCPLQQKLCFKQEEFSASLDFWSLSQELPATHSANILGLRESLWDANLWQKASFG